MKAKLLFLALTFSALFTYAQTGLNFDGVNDYVVGPDNSSLDLYQATIEGWIKTTNAGTYDRGIIVKQYNFGIYLYNNELMVFENGTGRRIYPSPKINLADGIWHHIALSFNHTVVDGSKLYVDGLPVLTFTYTIPNVSARKIAVGNGKDDMTVNQFFKGDIDQVRIWNTIRTDAEILASYNKCLYGNETGLLMLWQFEEGTGTIATDLSGNNNNGTLTNMDSENWVGGYDCSNLVAYYPFNANANDESGSANHGTVIGATLTSDRFGNTDSAYNFDGNDIITIAYNEKLNANGELTISVWVKPNTQQDALILGKSNWWSQTNYLLRTKSTGFLQFEYRDMAYNNNIPLIVNEWNHIAVVSDANNIKKIYINNVLDTHTGGSSPFNMVQEVLTIGATGSNGYNAEYFNGSIDDVRIYKSTLSESEIANLYNYNTLKIEKIEDITTSHFYVFNNTLYFKNTQNINDIKSIEVFNFLGQKVFETSKIESQILLQNLAESIYFLKVENSSGTFSALKFIAN